MYGPIVDCIIIELRYEFYGNVRAEYEGVNFLLKKLSIQIQKVI